MSPGDGRASGRIGAATCSQALRQTACWAPIPQLNPAVHAALAQQYDAHLPVAEVQTNHELLEDPARVDLQQAAVGLLPQQVLKQVPALSKLHGNAQVGGREEHLQGSRCSPQGLT